MVRPFIKDMTLSELHAVLTGGFATIAGSVMAAYILYGVSEHVHAPPHSLPTVQVAGYSYTVHVHAPPHSLPTVQVAGYS